MTLLRALRILVIAVGFSVAFAVSQAATLAREGQVAPGIRWAVGGIALVFLVRALTTERFRGPEANLQKDVLWGIGCGGLLTIFSHC